MENDWEYLGLEALEWITSRRGVAVTKVPSHLCASSQGIQHQGNKGQTERRDVLKQRQPTSSLKQRLSAFRDGGEKTVTEQEPKDTHIITQKAMYT